MLAQCRCGRTVMREEPCVCEAPPPDSLEKWAEAAYEHIVRELRQVPGTAVTCGEWDSLLARARALGVGRG